MIVTDQLVPLEKPGISRMVERIMKKSKKQLKFQKKRDIIAKARLTGRMPE